MSARTRGAAAALVAGALDVGALGAQSPQIAPRPTVSPSASITTYTITNSNPLFGSERRSWTEASVVAGARATHGRLGLDVAGLGVNTFGRDPYGTGTGLVDGSPATGAGVGGWSVGVERAALSLVLGAARAGAPTLIVGRQRIEIGSQFLIGDGVFDGFSSTAPQAVYHNPRKSFDAVRLRGAASGVDFDAFGYKVSPTWDGGGGRDGRVAGMELGGRIDRTGTTIAVGGYRRSSRSKLDNDMTVIDVRLEQAVPALPGVGLSGELVSERGRCRNAAYCSSPGSRLKEWAGHVELRIADTVRQVRPSLELGAVHYSADFTPLAPGASDWGRWYLGNQIDWMAFASNVKVLRGEAALWPAASVRVRAQYHESRQVVPTGGTGGGPLSREGTLIGEWYPSARLWVNLVLGYSRAGRALAASGLANPFAGINAGAVAAGTRSSHDVIVATGITF